MKLFSNSIDNYITKLDDGTFEVKLPIKEELKDKNLTVYYVDDNNKIEEHKVTIKDGYAIFTTNHFSIYTLAEQTSTVEEQPEENKTNNPQTSDNINIYTSILLISTIGVISLSYIYIKNKKKWKQEKN